MKYADPYLAGVALGLVLIGAFVLTGHGLGASGGFAAAAAATAAATTPLARENAYFARYLADGIANNWLVWELAGVVVGAFVSAVLAGRWRLEIQRGAGVAAGARLAAAAAGGAAMGAGAMLARGCTSGLALSGGALLSVGSWVFVVCAFAAGFACAPLVRGSWR